MCNFINYALLFSLFDVPFEIYVYSFLYACDFVILYIPQLDIILILKKKKKKKKIL